MCHNYWACMPQLLKLTHSRARVPQQEDPLQWETCAPQLKSSPPLPQLERPMQSNKDPTQPINRKKNCSAGWCGPGWESWLKAPTRGRGVVRSRAMSTASLASAPLMMTNFSGTWSPHPFTYSKDPSRQNSLKSKPVSHFLQGFGTLFLNR